MNPFLPKTEGVKWETSNNNYIVLHTAVLKDDLTLLTNVQWNQFYLRSGAYNNKRNKSGQTLQMLPSDSRFVIPEHILDPLLCENVDENIQAFPWWHSPYGLKEGSEISHGFGTSELPGVFFFQNARNTFGSCHFFPFFNIQFLFRDLCGCCCF